jgi:hypothetical protein
LLCGLTGAAGEAGRDAVVVALLPRPESRLGEEEAKAIGRRWPGTVVVQFWGDVDREAMQEQGIRCWPKEAPVSGHMGILPSDLGPDPIVRLQAGGLKVGEILSGPAERRTAADEQFIDPI